VSLLSNLKKAGAANALQLLGGGQRAYAKFKPVVF